MRTLAIVGLLLFAAAASADARPRVTRCCLVVSISGVPVGPACTQLRVRGRRLDPRRACRYLGGAPIGRGDCTPGACDARAR